jgi:single-strand DNA-binding protein
MAWYSLFISPNVTAVTKSWEEEVMSIASVSIVGNLVKAPQQVQFSSGKIKATMTIAVNTPFREKRGGDAADFYRVEAWGKLAEQAVSRLAKGNQVTANGRLTMEKWTDNNGKERVTPTISANEIAFPQKAKTIEPATAQPEDTPISAKTRRSADDADTDDDGEYEEEEDAHDDYGEPNRQIKPEPMRSNNGGPG